MKQSVSQDARRFVVFDIDGTLIRWQLFHVMVDKLAAAGALGPDAKVLLKKARMVWKRREHPEAFKAYEKALIQIYERALTNLKTETFDTFVTDIIDEYKDQTYVYSRNLLQKVKNEGYFSLIISGSHHELIEQIGKYYGFDDWIGSTYERGELTFSGQKYIASQAKAEALQSMVHKHNLSYEDSIGIGDSASDIPMLKLVQNPIAFNPDQKLLDTAKRSSWPIVIERKNVIYRLEAKNDGYELVS